MMKRRILFVDDEIRILQGFKRLLRQYGDEWDVIYVESGQEALRILSLHNIDIIITDMRMPQMDGIELLGTVQKTYPNVIRIVLSGYSDKGTAIRIPKVAHRFISKPCNSEELISVIKNVLELKKRFINADLLAVIAGLDNLPSVPEFYDKLKNEISSSDVSIKKIGEILTQDIAMTAKILQLVNSAFFGLPQKITDTIQAVSFLGVEVVKSLVLFEKIFSSLNCTDPYKIFYDEIYSHSLKVGNLAREIAAKEVDDKQIADEAFIGGLLHDIGKLVCLGLTDYPTDIRKNMKIKGISYIESEIDLYDTTHCEVGTYLLNLWGLPEDLFVITENHHSPWKTGNSTFTALSSVYIANTIINNEKPNHEYLENLNIQPDKYIDDKTE